MEVTVRGLFKYDVQRRNNVAVLAVVLSELGRKKMSSSNDVILKIRFSDLANLCAIYNEFTAF